MQKPAEKQKFKPEHAESGYKAAGRADIYPMQARSGSRGNTVNITFTPGEDIRDYTVLKISIPEGWSDPSRQGKDEGYFSVDVEEGKLTSSDVQDRNIILEVFGLKPGKGRIRVKYGDKSMGGSGARASEKAGTDIFRVESGAGPEDGTAEIETSPGIEKT